MQRGRMMALLYKGGGSSRRISSFIHNSFVSSSSCSSSSSSSCSLQCSRLLPTSLERLHASLFTSNSRAYCSKEDDDIAEFNAELETVFGRPLHQDALSKKGGQLSAYGTSDHTQPNLSMNSSLTHVDDSGKASMVNIMEKSSTYRLAAASGRVLLGTLAFELVCANKISKGDVLTVAQIAGIQAAKQASNLIPLCHNILLAGVKVDLSLNRVLHAVEVRAEVTSVGPTGVEMEALTAVSVACLTVYDMCKAASKEIKICNIQLESKSGGKSGDWHRTNM